MNKEKQIQTICARYDNQRHRMMDVLLEVQRSMRCIDAQSMTLIAKFLNCRRIDVEGPVTFYSFLSDKPVGHTVIRLCDDIVDRHKGALQISQALEEELNIAPGDTTPDGTFSLHHTPCIGMSDQAPAAMIDDQIFTQLTPDKAVELVRALKTGKTVEELIPRYGNGNNAASPVQAMVENNLHQRGKSLFADPATFPALHKTLARSTENILDEIDKANLRGFGGAGYPTAKKWRMAAQTQAARRFIFCNADEGEPGTFKDRVLLTERPDLMIEGMTLAARAIGAEEGLIYLRGEYIYLRDWLESVLERRRRDNLLGINICGRDGFNFDIRLQMGAGSYVCGEESAMISSCEGLMGEPKTKPPYPAERGYLGSPTVVCNVETFCHAARILHNGAEWFAGLGTDNSNGTKALSISGDCTAPGVYEIEWGISLHDVVKMAGGQDIGAIQVAGPSGELVPAIDFDRRLCFEDLPTGGAIILFSTRRNILEIVDYYTGFFAEESCGFCTPCRVGNVFLKERIETIRHGNGVAQDLAYLKDLSRTIVKTSRCGLGHTSPNPILSSMRNFPLVYAAVLKDNPDGHHTNFNIQDALEKSRRLARHRSYIFDPDFEEGEPEQ